MPCGAGAVGAAIFFVTCVPVTAVAVERLKAEARMKMPPSASFLIMVIPPVFVGFVG